jgi:hypothetical protein
MPRKAIDIMGEKFGKLTVLKRDNDRNGNIVYWLCVCGCGKQISTTSYRLRKGKVKSCGCSRYEYIGKANKTHGMSKTRIHKIWCHINERCNTKTHKQYSDYGGRGIKVYDEWSNNFSAFLNWAKENGYKDNLTIDRIDNDGDYRPDNCRWTDKFTQQNNQRRTVRITIGDVTKTLSEWALHTGINKATLSSRYYSGKKGMDLIRQYRDTYKRGRGGAIRSK